MDKQAPTTYGTKYIVATGPYMIKSDPKTGTFENIGYQTGKSLTLVRNPNWKASTDTGAGVPQQHQHQHRRRRDRDRRSRC